MDLESNDGRVMHIDTSRRFNQRGHTGIAFKIVGTNIHKGLGLSNKLKRELDEHLNAKEDYARLYAICIYYLVKDVLDNFDILIICNDENFTYVKLYLDKLFLGNQIYLTKTISSLSKFRKVMGNPKIRSYADNIAATYRRKVFLNKPRKERGIKLNIVKVNYKKIIEKWNLIDKLLKKV